MCSRKLAPTCVEKLQLSHLWDFSRMLSVLFPFRAKLAGPGIPPMLKVFLSDTNVHFVWPSSTYEVNGTTTMFSLLTSVTKEDCTLSFHLVEERRKSRSPRNSHWRDWKVKVCDRKSSTNKLKIFVLSGYGIYSQIAKVPIIYTDNTFKLVFTPNCPQLGTLSLWWWNRNHAHIMMEWKVK